MEDLPRVFLPPEAFQGDTVTLTGDAFHHLCRVLRLKAGDRLYALDGLGSIYHVRLDDVAKTHATAAVTAKEAASGEPRVPVTLAAALIKGDRWDWLLQKATELGAHRIQPLVTARTVVQVDPRKAADKQARWQKIVLEAAEQSERGQVPEVLPALTLSAFLAGPRPGLTLACLERAGQPLPAVLEASPAPEAVTVLVGPEGGFAPQETQELLAAGARGVSLGSRILRAETAGMAVLAMLAYHYELAPAAVVRGI